MTVIPVTSSLAVFATSHFGFLLEAIRWLIHLAFLVFQVPTISATTHLGLRRHRRNASSGLKLPGYRIRFQMPIWIT